ncbi:MAG: hypothetical protein DMG85_20090 [Acidobacteria bacterium]|nr:MAG: hypothetical protein DMG85_20090 [Acidobacteriota bacterium]
MIVAENITSAESQQCIPAVMEALKKSIFSFYLSTHQKLFREIRSVTFWNINCMGGCDCSCGPDHSDQTRALLPKSFDTDSF